MHVEDWLDYDPKDGVFTWKVSPGNHVHIGDLAGTENAAGYTSITVCGERFYAHRMAFKFMGETVPDVVDHANGIKSDNRWDNLRPATKTQNGYNAKCRIDNKFGVKGLSFDVARNRWRASITADSITYQQRFIYKEDAEDWLIKQRDLLHRHFGRL